jgi:ATP-binding cassette subfamily F protein 3
VEREARRALTEARARNQAKRIEEIERFIDRFRYQATKARQVQSRIKMLEKVERIEADGDSRRIHFKFPQPPRTGRIVMRLDGVRKAYGDNVVYAGVNFIAERAERIALVGVNGAGKSTLLKMLAGVLPPDAGERVLGSHVEVHYYAQHQLDALDPAHTVLEELEGAAPDATHTRLRTILGSFLFSGDAVDKRVAVLSGGEKARLALAKMLVRPAALLCMDEPTNHLDLASKEVLEEALAGFTGTIVFISHDRYFINRIGTRVVEVQGGRLTDYLGNYDDYLAASAARTSPEPPSTPAPRRPDGTYGAKTPAGSSRNRPAAALAPPAPASAPAPVRPAPAREPAPPRRQGSSEKPGRRALEREVKAIRARLETIEKQIAEMETRLADIGLTLADPDLYRDGNRAREISESRRQAEEQVAWLMKEWEELSERLTAVEGG